MPDSNILAFLFSTAAALVATLTGLIGGFATFRLQRMDAKLDFLKDYVLHKEITNDTTLNEKLRDVGYSHIERVYLHNMNAVNLLKQLVHELDYHQHSDEYSHDLSNITRHQIQYDRIKKHTARDFIFSLSFVFVSLALLLFTNAILSSSFVWFLLIIFFATVAIVFYKFIM
ncbi:MAG TPA: hypothetical protein PL045_02580, partial [Chitinophagaceae bacterium]|nr:hypothetical protein [Chitinophagaceae bacterium]